MTRMARYMEYYDAFEEFYDSNDASLIEPFFTDDAVYEVTGSAALANTTRGRDAVLARFAAGLDGLDRRFPVKRHIEFLDDEVEARDDYVKVPGLVHYQATGGPPLRIEMTEEAWFRGDRIAKLVDTIPDAQATKMAEYVAKHLS